jgi:hypothetical protein
VRALLATAGLVVLAGSAAAGTPTAHTIRKSPNGPIEAVAQDGNLAAWLTFAGTQGCNTIHLMTPGKPDRTLPQASPDSMTCTWDLTDGQSQLAIASRTATALWTLHENGPTSFDEVLAATAAGPERRVDRLSHASDGTGQWLVGVAGSGKTLAYSWDDVEYVDKLACLSGGSCKRKIADGGIRVVTRTGYTALPTAGPALQLATSAGRIAYIPATRVPANRPGASPNSPIYLVDAVSGASLGQVVVRGVPAAIALSPRVLAVLTQRGPRDRITWFSTTDDTKLGSVLVSPQADTELAASDDLIIYRVNGALREISTASGHMQALPKTSPDSVGLSLSNGRLVWAVNKDNVGRLRALLAG